MINNPYQATTLESSPGRERRSLRRIVPALLFLFLGVGVIGMMAIATILLLSGIARPIPLSSVQSFIGVSEVLSCAILCIVASVNFWLARYKSAVYAVVGAFAILAIATAVDILF